MGHLAEIWQSISESILAGTIANSLDRGLYRYWELLTKSKTNSIFEGVYIYIYFMAIHIKKNGHIAPLQKCLFINILSLFDMENILGGS